MAGKKPQQQSIPLAREELEVGKREVETGRVRIHKVVREHEELIDTPLMHEEIDVQRVPVNRELDAPAQPRQEGDVLIVPVVEERLVVQKRLVLVEELHVRRRAVERPHQERVVLRSEEAVVERDPEVQPQHERK
jgi:uncharacterized protein (TIGR02271 family)